MQVKKLIKVDGNANNNKYYEMYPKDDGTFMAKWGRVEGGKGESQVYPEGTFEKKYREKLRKGYVDVTEMSIVQESGDFAPIKDKAVASIVSDLQSFSNNSIKNNYSVSSQGVTQKQVDEAQNVLNELTILGGLDSFSLAKQSNERLEKLFTIIPRKMKKVSDHLLNYKSGIKYNILKEDLHKKIAEEQATLDVMAGQVSANTKTVNHTNNQSILEALGLDITKVKDTDVDRIKKLLGRDSQKYRNAWRVRNNATQERFNTNLAEAEHKNTKLFWHGSRNENWWSILNSGLVLRPTNAVISGKMFGYGLYFADKAGKSIGYTSLQGSYWANGNARSAYLALFDVHLGWFYHTKKHEHYMSDLTWEKLRKRGDYDSLFAEGGVDLRNNEYIVYKQDQATVHYLVEIGN